MFWFKITVEGKIVMFPLHSATYRHYHPLDNSNLMGKNGANNTFLKAPKEAYTLTIANTTVLRASTL